MAVMKFTQVKLDAKRRPALPAHLLEEVGTQIGQSVVVRPDGPGRLLIETQEASRAEIRTRVRSMVTPVDVGGDAAADVRSQREQDIAISDAAFEHRSRITADADSESRGKELLDLLGL